MHANTNTLSRIHTHTHYSSTHSLSLSLSLSLYLSLSFTHTLSLSHTHTTHPLAHSLTHPLTHPHTHRSSQCLKTQRCLEWMTMWISQRSFRRRGNCLTPSWSPSPSTLVAAVGRRWRTLSMRSLPTYSPRFSPPSLSLSHIHACTVFVYFYMGLPTTRHVV